MLYQRDYRELTKEEIIQLTKAKSYLLPFSKTEIPVDALYKYHEILPKAYYHYNSLFPNNYLNSNVLKNTDKLIEIQNDFVTILDSQCTERDLLNFINKDDNFIIIASLFQEHRFGHHKAFLFKEFELTATHRADYLLVGKASDGYSFIFVELENPKGQITKKNGEFGTVFRKGIKQVEDWDTWIEGNFSTLKLVFDKYKQPNRDLPNEFITLDKSRVYYVVIAGRRSDFKDKTYELKRKYKKRNNVMILHYDNLVDLFDFLKIRQNY